MSLPHAADILAVLRHSQYHGRSDRLGDTSGFVQLLTASGLLDLSDYEEMAAAEVGRDILNTFVRLGFVTPHLSEDVDKGRDAELVRYIKGVEGLTGCAYEVTRNGMVFMEADSYQKKEETVLRALLNYCLPSVLQPDFSGPRIYPVRLVIDVLLRLEEIGEHPCLSVEEIAAVLPRHVRTAEIVAEIGELRARSTYDQKAKHKTAVAEHFADDNQPYNTIRWLKATGLFRGQDGGLVISPTKRKLVEFIVKNAPPQYEDGAYLRGLWHGAHLPSDNKAVTLAIIQDLLSQLVERCPPRTGTAVEAV